MSITLEILSASLEISIERRKVLPEVLQCSFEERLRNEELSFHIFLTNLVTSFTSQDNEFTDDILATQIDARIGFAVTSFLCQTNCLAERDILTNCIEDKVESSTQNCLNLKYFVSRVTEVVDGSDDGKTSTDIRLEEEFDASLLTGFFE